MCLHVVTLVSTAIHADMQMEHSATMRDLPQEINSSWSTVRDLFLCVPHEGIPSWLTYLAFDLHKQACPVNKRRSWFKSGAPQTIAMR